MPRPMSSAMLAAITARQMYPAIFIEALFLTGWVYIWSGYGTISWNGHNWLGVGSLASVSPIEDGTTIEARGISIGLSGIDNSLLADVLQEFKIGAPAAVYLGMFSGGSPVTLLASPIVSWAGRMDQPTLDIGAETATITINAESHLLLHNVPCSERYTQDTQARFYPGDKAFLFLLGLQNQVLTWGRVPSSSGT